MMGVCHSAMSIRQRDPDVLHHPLIFMIEDVAMQNEVADVALITRAYDDRVHPRWPALWGNVLDEERVLPKIFARFAGSDEALR